MPCSSWRHPFACAAATRPPGRGRPSRRRRIAPARRAAAPRLSPALTRPARSARGSRPRLNRRCREPVSCIAAEAQRASVATRPCDPPGRHRPNRGRFRGIERCHQESRLHPAGSCEARRLLLRVGAHCMLAGAGRHPCEDHLIGIPCRNGGPQLEEIGDPCPRGQASSRRG
jgi:hypothetical protein